MTVYIEDCIIENFVVTFLVIMCVNASLKAKTNKLKVIIACTFASASATFYPLLGLNGFLLFLLKACIGILIVAIVYSSKNFLAKYLAFMFFTALYGGLNMLTYYAVYGTLNVVDNFPTYILLGILLTAYFVIKMSIKYAQKKFVISNFVYNVKITNNGDTFCINAFLDSGNALLDEDSTPIFIINATLFNKLYKNISFSDLLVKNFKNLKEPHYVKSCFASGGANILVFSVERVQICENSKITKEFTNARLGVSYAKFAKNFDCDMLLNICAFT